MLGLRDVEPDQSAPSRSTKGKGKRWSRFLGRIAFWGPRHKDQQDQPVILNPKRDPYIDLPPGLVNLDSPHPIALNSGDGPQTANPPLPGTAVPDWTEMDGEGGSEPGSLPGDASSIRSLASNRSTRSRASRGSGLSFHSSRSRFSRRSRVSRSSQRSYENPILDSAQTLLHLVTTMEADNSWTILKAVVLRRNTPEEELDVVDRYFTAVQCLKDQVKACIAHPAVVNSSVHTSPRELVMLCDRLRTMRTMDRIADDGRGTARNADMLEQVASELKTWFDAFLVSAQAGATATTASQAGRLDPLVAGRNNLSALGTSSEQGEARQRPLILLERNRVPSKPRS